MEKKIESDKNRDHCHLAGRYRGPAHNICTINVSQQQSKFFAFISHNFSVYDCHMLFNRLVDLKKKKVKVKIIPSTNEEYISVMVVSDLLTVIDSCQVVWINWLNF